MTNMNRQLQIDALNDEWENSPRWNNVTRSYSAEDVVKLRGSVTIEHTLARLGATKFWRMINGDDPICGLGAMTGNQAIQEVQAGLKAIYCSGWQVAGDGNSAGQMYPDQSLYPVDSVPKMVERINNALTRTDEIHALNGDTDIDWFAPIIADAEAGFGGNLNAYELMKGMIRAGASGVHFEDQLSSAKKCGHMGGKVLVPTARRDREADWRPAWQPTSVVCRPCSSPAPTPTAAGLLTSDADPRDHAFRRPESEPSDRLLSAQRAGHRSGHRAWHRLRAPMPTCIWCETAHPDLAEAKRFAEAVHAEYPGKLLAYNCSPVLQLEGRTSTTRRSKVFQRRAGRDGLQVPVHYAGRLARPESQHV